MHYLYSIILYKGIKQIKTQKKSPLYRLVPFFRTNPQKGDLLYFSAIIMKIIFFLSESD